ncbi:MBL fold metallo-hydrolase [Bacillus sp. MRMR6]|uniref:MBL fold metallo-hydrolase n=1 Tax=Bacillus sp. MRMR6 TaxID=1928617 RepID=UPI000951DBA4|nr:MBL fold metallo-hydrolase [Bacillus sp. MRMR6]OLS40655.1 MBL fold metallo-hydrolase [Bacillus sp. MRMR6]
MHKRYLFALMCFFTIFLISGCGQPSTESKLTDQVKQQEIGSNDSMEQKETKDEEKVVTKELSDLKVHYIDVGQADSTLLQFPYQGEVFNILIDAGNWNGNEVVNYLIAQKVNQVDIAIGTHPDADHIGQLDKVLNTFSVGEVWLSGNTNPSQTFQRLLTAIDAKDVEYYEPRMGDTFEIGQLTIDVLYPKTISENDNDESISLKFTYGDVRFIFTGDASTGDELKMLQSGFDVQADILQLGHHGSSTSTHPNFLSKVNPTVAIYSAGLNNTYGHPHAEVVNLIQSRGIQLYGTDVHGTIIVTTDGKDYKILTKKEGTISPSSSGNTTNDETNSRDSQNETNPMIGSCIDVNTATLAELQEIIHFGAARAQALIDSRPFTSIDDLSRISGIGPARIKDIKKQGVACIGG